MSRFSRTKGRRAVDTQFRTPRSSGVNECAGGGEPRPQHQIGRQLDKVNARKKAGNPSNHAAAAGLKHLAERHATEGHESAQATSGRDQLKHRWLVQAAFVGILDEIIDDSRPGETPASKLRQLGMIVYIIELAGKGKAITLTALVEASGLTRSGVGEIMDKLVERGCLVETMGRNAWGRGKARQFSIGGTILGALQR